MAAGEEVIEKLAKLRPSVRKEPDVQELLKIYPVSLS
jgi:hypothetical protein